MSLCGRVAVITGGARGLGKAYAEALLQKQAKVRRYMCHNTSKPRQNGRYFAEDLFECVSLCEGRYNLIQNSLKVVPSGPIASISALFKTMAPNRYEHDICTVQPQHNNACIYFLSCLI